MEKVQCMCEAPDCEVNAGLNSSDTHTALIARCNYGGLWVYNAMLRLLEVGEFLDVEAVKILNKARLELSKEMVVLEADRQMTMHSIN